MGKICSKSTGRDEAEGKPEQVEMAPVPTEEPHNRRFSVRRASGKIAEIQQGMKTARGRGTLREFEAIELAKAAALEFNPSERPEEPLKAPPVSTVSDGSWQIKGVYKHAVLKAGLRRLDETWPEGDIDTMPDKKLFRSRLIHDLLSGTLELKSLPSTDVGAMQGDIKELTLRQLLRLRTRLLEYRPSGAGADQTSTIGSTQEAFMNVLDATMFLHLGEKTLDKERKEGEAYYKIGVEAILIFAAAAGFVEENIKPPTPWWCWCITDEHRIFFDPIKNEVFKGKKLPKEGVMMVVDRSHPDHNEPTGNLIWFEWNLHHAKTEEDLAEAEPFGGKKVVAKEGEETEATHGLTEATVQNKRKSLKSVRGSLATLP